MRLAAAFVGVLLVLATLWDAFEVMVLPRRVARRLRIVRLFFRLAWSPWRGVVARVGQTKRREALLSSFGPLSILALVVLWALLLIAGFALLQWAARPATGDALRMGDAGYAPTFWTFLYLSGTTFFTLGFGDITPNSAAGHLLAVVEAGLGFGFLAAVIGYLPVLYGAFSGRESQISILDARAGSPPSAGEFLRRHAELLRAGDAEPVERFLANWEEWSARLLESTLSYPVLCYYRSQHYNESWLAALVFTLDASAFVLAAFDDSLSRCRHQARLTFAMARHALVDVAQLFDPAPQFRRLRESGAAGVERLSAAELNRLCDSLAARGVPLRRDARSASAAESLRILRAAYEPFAVALSDYLLMPLPAWDGEESRNDNWQTSKWMRPVSRDALDGDGACRTPDAEAERAGEEHAW